MIRKIILVLLATLPLAACPPRGGHPGPGPGPDPFPGPNTPAPGPR
jgi:hypothetical protein